MVIEGSLRHSSFFFLKAAALYNNNRVVFSGTSLRIFVMLEQLSPSRKELFIPKYPPLFVSQTVQRYLTEFKVDDSLIEKVKDSLVGRLKRKRPRPYIFYSDKLGKG